ncbi:MAG TPA: phytoene desaturase family protein [bacterium]|nr:phytoene desaturase family protein [bacterium]HOY45214.1 phytoene desaturase family protein [bacterium]HPG83492.1 phytoene desaturase family protein [bacterium]HPM59154.1 phytoene desaturase family protein [bacterium]
MARQVAVIGGGLAGLSGAIELARRGFSVDLFEQTGRLGGKMNEVRREGFRFDTGPSLLTMPFVLEKLFADAGFRRREFLDLVPIEPMCRYFFADGSRLDASSDAAAMETAITMLSERDRGRFARFMAYSRRIYDLTAEVFLFTPIHEWKRVLKSRHLSTLGALPAIDPLRTVHRGVKRFFRDDRLVQLFDRYATYNGSNPYQAPATLNIIPYVEYGFGGFYVRGGMYRLVEALQRLATILGVRIHTGMPVEEIVTEKGRVAGVRVDGALLRTERVLCSADVVTAFNRLLPGFAKERRRLNRLEPSLSGMIFLWGVKKSHPGLAHHNIFFSADYSHEFSQIFDGLRAPDDPTVYVAITSRADAEDAPEGMENWFVLVNMPYLRPGAAEPDAASVRQTVLSRLRQQEIDVSGAIACEEVITPRDFLERYGSNAGSIYGISSNSRSMAFRRPANRSRAVPGLFLAGGACHPGGGIPLVLLSGRMAAELIAEME